MPDVVASFFLRVARQFLNSVTTSSRYLPGSSFLDRSSQKLLPSPEGKPIVKPFTRSRLPANLVRKVFLAAALDGARTAYAVSLVCKDAHTWVAGSYTLYIFDWARLIEFASELKKYPTLGRGIHHLWIALECLQKTDDFIIPVTSADGINVRPSWESPEWHERLEEAATVALDGCPNLLSLALVPPLWGALREGRYLQFRLVEFITSASVEQAAFPTFAPALANLQRIHIVSDRDCWWIGNQLKRFSRLRIVHIYWTSIPRDTDVNRFIDRTLESDSVTKIFCLSDKVTLDTVCATVDTGSRVQLKDIPIPLKANETQFMIVEWSHRIRIPAFWV